MATNIASEQNRGISTATRAQRRDAHRLTETFGNKFVISPSRWEIVSLSDSMVARLTPSRRRGQNDPAGTEQAGACGSALNESKQAGACGWALNEGFRASRRLRLGVKRVKASRRLRLGVKRVRASRRLRLGVKRGFQERHDLLAGESGSVVLQVGNRGTLKPMFGSGAISYGPFQKAPKKQAEVRYIE